MSERFFGFDVTLKDLLNLEQRAKTYDRLHDLFTALKQTWYRLEGDRKAEIERWNQVRIGSVDVRLDEEGHLHIDFVTRFSVQEALLKVLRGGRPTRLYDLVEGPPFEPALTDDRPYLNSQTIEPL